MPHSFFITTHKASTSIPSIHRNYSHHLAHLDQPDHHTTHKPSNQYTSPGHIKKMVFPPSVAKAVLGVVSVRKAPDGKSQTVLRKTKVAEGGSSPQAKKKTDENQQLKREAEKKQRLKENYAKAKLKYERNTNKDGLTYLAFRTGGEKPDFSKGERPAVRR